MAFMYVIDGLLVFAMLFFLFLPINDFRTARMRLCVVCVIAAGLAVSLTTTHAPNVQVASAAHVR